MPSGGPQSFRAGYGSGTLQETWGAALHERTQRSFGRSFEWGIIGEDLPDPKNRVELSRSLVDSSAVPAPKVSYRVSNNTHAMLEFHIARVCEAMEASEAHSISVTPMIRDCGWHLMGTAVMGDDPNNSVVDRWGRSHDVENLFVMDGSTFPTSSGVNPTATIMAVAHRFSQALVRQRSHRRHP